MTVEPDITTTPRTVPRPRAMVTLVSFAQQVREGRERVLVSDDPKGPHQLRVGLRRLRSGVAFFQPVLPVWMARGIGQEARWLGQEVGQLRDLDVLWRDTIAPRAAADPADEGLAALDHLFYGATLRMQVTVRKTLCGPRVGRFIEDLSALSNPSCWALPGDRAKKLLPLTQQVLDQNLQRAARRGKRFDRLDTEDRHRFRKDLKKLRYSLEIARALHERKATKRFVKALKSLQDRLGAMNDAAVAECILGAATAELAADDPPRLAALSLIQEMKGPVDLDAKKVRSGWRAISKAPML